MNKDSIEFTAIYKGKKRNFKISCVTGGAGSMWHLYIDKFYKGLFVVYQGKWDFRPQKEDYFTPEQIRILEEQLTKHQPIK